MWLPEVARNGGAGQARGGNGERPSSSSGSFAIGGRTEGVFHTLASFEKIRRFNNIALVFRVVGFCFVLTSTIFMIFNSHDSSPTTWFNYDAFRYLVVVNTVVDFYCFFQMAAVLWEILNGNTLMPVTLQLWFDSVHDQAFAYLLFSANSSATTLTQNLKGGRVCVGLDAPCGGTNAFCTQSFISTALGFGASLCLAASAMLSGFRVACFIFTGSRFYV